MELPKKITQHEVVDTTIKNLRSMGFEPDAQSIAFIWRIARKEVSSDEVNAWRTNILLQMGRRRDEQLGRYCFDKTALIANLLRVSDQMAMLKENFDRVNEAIHSSHTAKPLQAS